MGVKLLINSLGALAIYIAFARFSSKETFGQYQFIISVFSIIYIFSIPGFNTSLLRSVALGFDGDYREVVKKSFLWSLLAVPIFFILGAYYYVFESHALGFSLLLASVFFPFFYAPNTWEWFLQGKHKFDVLAKFSSIQSLFNMVATILVIILSKDNLVLIVLFYFVSYTFFNGLYYFKSLKFIENSKKDKEVLQYGWFLNNVSILSVIANNIDKVLVGILLGPANLAIYGVISLIATKIKDVVKSFMSMLFPKMSAFGGNFSDFTKIHKKKLMPAFFVLSVCSVVYFLAIPMLNRLMFTDEYSRFSYLSQIFAVTVFLSVPLGFLGYYVNAKKNRFAIIITNPVFYIIRILLNLYLIVEFGLFGAAVAFNLSMIIWFILYLAGISRDEKAVNAAG